jgi:hypothetical protein
MINQNIAHLKHPDGTLFQVLINDEEGNPIDWDEAATHQAYQAYDQSLNAPENAEV